MTGIILAIAGLAIILFTCLIAMAVPDDLHTDGLGFMVGMGAAFILIGCIAELGERLA